MVDGDSTGRRKTAGVFLMKESAWAKARDRRKYFYFAPRVCWAFKSRIMWNSQQPNELGASVFQRRKPNLGRINNVASESQDYIPHVGQSQAVKPRGATPTSCFSHRRRLPLRGRAHFRDSVAGSRDRGGKWNQTGE